MRRQTFFKYLGLLTGTPAIIKVTGGAPALSGLDTDQTKSLASTANNTADFKYTRDLQVEVITNQLGFLPNASKRCLVSENPAPEFQIIKAPTGEVVFRGSFQSAEKDFGKYSIGDFSSVTEQGTYYIQADSLRSYPFQIRDRIYDETMQKIVSYFSTQRCGPSTTGYLTPCHADDGIRKDNGKYQDVSGGWHDATDLRKWVGATIYGMIGLSHLAEDLNPAWDEGEVMEELRWGNRYFLKMQEPDGYVMSHIGGDISGHASSNRWTDNIIGDQGGELKNITPDYGETDTPMTVYGEKDDRVIETDPLNFRGQYDFIIAQARMTRLTRQADPEYGEQCLKAAKDCIHWCLDQDPGDSVGDLGALVEALVELYNTTYDDHYADVAVQSARRLMNLQVTTPISTDAPISGFFLESENSSEPYKQISRTNYTLIGLCDLIGAFPSHADAPMWKDAIRRYILEYLVPIMDRNNYKIAPFGLFTENDPGGNRKIGQYWYRYFMVPEDWWVGINANLASEGIGLVKAANILQEPFLLNYAQYQLDWILGINPFYASTVEGVGHNHPKRFINSNEYRPETPVIPGAVMNGLGGTADDQPAKYDSSWMVAEYWTPMVGHTLWLMALLEKNS